MLFLFLIILLFFSFFLTSRFRFIISTLEKEEIINQKLSVDESLCALKDCKRAVEIRYKNILTEVSEQSIKCDSLIQANETLKSQNKSYEFKIQSLEQEKNEQTYILAELQQSLIQKTSEYESQIRNMQIELGNRLDEINVVKKEDVDKVKGHYMDLFQEKASEVMILRDEAERLNQIIEGYKSKVKDLEYREEELNNIVNKMREGKLESSDENQDLHSQLQDSLKASEKLTEKVEKLENQFKTIKDSSEEKFQSMDFHILELEAVIKEKDRELDTFRHSCNNQKNPENTQPDDNHVSQLSSQHSHSKTDSNHNISMKPKNKKKKRKSKTAS